jgi:hypothetical protein
MGRTVKKRRGEEDLDVWGQLRSLTTRVSRWRPWKRALLYGAAAMMVIVMYTIFVSGREEMERIQKMTRK